MVTFFWSWIKVIGLIIRLHLTRFNLIYTIEHRPWLIANLNGNYRTMQPYSPYASLRRFVLMWVIWNYWLFHGVKEFDEHKQTFSFWCNWWWDGVKANGKITL